MPSSLLPTLAQLATGRLSAKEVDESLWPSLVQLAFAHKLAPLLYYHLSNRDELEILPMACWTRLLASFSEVAANGLLAQEQVAVWDKRLADAGIKAVWLKGAALSHTVYADPAMRPMTDIDVLVPLAQARRALALVTDVTGQEPASLPLEQAIHAVFNVGPAGLIKMELHWSLIDIPRSRRTPDVAWFLSQTAPFKLGSQKHLTLQPEAHLLYLCAHAQIGHGEADFQISRYLDIHNLLQATPTFDWQIVIDKAIEFGWTYAVERALSWACGFFATDVPNTVFIALHELRPAHEEATFVAEQITNHTRWQRIQSRVQAVEGRSRWKFALSQAFPPPAYMRWRYGWSGWKLPFAYPYRWLIALGAIAKTVLGRRDARV